LGMGQISTGIEKDESELTVVLRERHDERCGDIETLARSYKSPELKSR